MRHDLWFALAIDPTALFEHTIGSTCDKWQSDLLLSTDQRGLICTGRQVGKTTAVSVLAAHEAMFKPDSLTIIVSPSLRQSGEVFTRALQVIKKAGADVSKSSVDTGPANAPKLEKQTATEAKVPGGGRLLSLPGGGTADASIRGYTPSLVVIDEAARVNDLVYTALRPMVAVSKGRLICLSSPFGRRGFFWEAWRSNEDWLRVKIPATECARVDPAWLEKERESMTAWEFRSEYLAEFQDNAATAFAAELVQRAVDPAVEPLVVPPLMLISR